MPRSVNKVLLIGNLGDDAETRHTQSGTAVTTFRLATTWRSKDQSGEWNEKTDWHDIVMWRGENVAPHLRKGKQVYVEGRLQTRSWEDASGQKRYRTEVVCDPFGLMLLGGRDGGGGSSSGWSGSRGGSAPPASSGGGGSSTAPSGGAPSGDASSGGPPPAADDDIPF